jgi:hypothetical protein
MDQEQLTTDYVSLADLSKRTGLSYDGLRHRVRTEGLPGLRRLGRRLFVHLAEFDRACKQAAREDRT